MARFLWDFLRELDAGFAFAGWQVRLGWQGTDFLSTCLPLCHTRLKCYGVVALKATGVATILVEQRVDAALSVGDRIAFMVAGQVAETR